MAPKTEPELVHPTVVAADDGMGPSPATSDAEFDPPALAPVPLPILHLDFASLAPYAASFGAFHSQVDPVPAPVPAMPIPAFAIPGMGIPSFEIPGMPIPSFGIPGMLIPAVPFPPLAGALREPEEDLDPKMVEAEGDEEMDDEQEQGTMEAEQELEEDR